MAPSSSIPVGEGSGAVGDPAAAADAGARFELLESKLRVPRVGDRGVERAALIARLEASDAPVVLVSAGAGYGKTTTLAQWVRGADAVRCAWVTLDHHDNDPVVLLAYVAAALDGVAPLGPDVAAALGGAGAGARVETQLVPRLGAALARMPDPVVLVLDDVHELTNARCIDAIVALAAHLADGSRLVLSTREPGALPVARWRTRGQLVEVGADDLRMEQDEAVRLLGSTAARFTPDDVAGLVDATEGWPAGLYLAALAAAATADAPGPRPTLSGNDPLVLDYLRAELIASLPDDELRFLTLTSPLERLTGPLCDAALLTTGSADRLEALHRSNHFVIALDRERGAYRCHHLLRQLLATELPRRWPDEIAPTLTRAFAWCLAEGHDTEAVAYAQASGDLDLVADAITRLAQPVVQSGRSETVGEWLRWMREHDDIGRHPALAVVAAIFGAVTGASGDAEVWTRAAESGTYTGTLPDGSASIASWRALLRCLRAQNGPARMNVDARLAVDGLAPTSLWRAMALGLLGMSEHLLGDLDAADRHFVDAVDTATALAARGATPVLVPVAQAERALVAIDDGRWADAEALSDSALHTSRRSRNPEDALHGLVFAVAARIAARRERADAAGELLVEAQRRLHGLTHAFPVVAVQTRLEMAYAYLALADTAGARTVLGEADDILRRVPGLDVLQARATALREQLAAHRDGVAGASALTAAELRVLPLLMTHLNYREIGERRFLSRHTVKSHVMSIYRKLDVSSRSDAIQRAQELGLL